VVLIYRIKIFKFMAWAYRPYIVAFKHLTLVITIDVGFLSGCYKGSPLMACGYDAENKFFSLTFRIVDEKHEDNWG
jgi:hypothetical protein